MAARHEAPIDFTMAAANMNKYNADLDRAAEELRQLQLSFIDFEVGEVD